MMDRVSMAILLASVSICAQAQVVAPLLGQQTTTRAGGQLKRVCTYKFAGQLFEKDVGLTQVCPPTLSVNPGVKTPAASAPLGGR